MADEIHKWTATQTYTALGAGNSGVTVANEHKYKPMRVAIANEQPDPDHSEHHVVKGNVTVSHLDIPAGFAVYVRCHDPIGEVFGHYRAYP